MLTAEQMSQMRRLLSSDRVTVPGNEVIALALLLQALDNEIAAVARAARITPLPPAPAQE